MWMFHQLKIWQTSFVRNYYGNAGVILKIIWRRGYWLWTRHRRSNVKRRRTERNHKSVSGRPLTGSRWWERATDKRTLPRSWSAPNWFAVCTLFPWSARPNRSSPNTGSSPLWSIWKMDRSLWVMGQVWAFHGLHRVCKTVESYEKRAIRALLALFNA